MNRLRNRIATAWACIKPWSINSQNRSLEKGFKDDHGKIYAFYHIYCGPNNWHAIVSEQIQTMVDSGLMQRIDHLYITIIGTMKQRIDILSLLPKGKTEIVYADTDGSCFEWPCLLKMREMAKEEEFKAVYFHSKGTSYSSENYDGKWGSYEHLLQCIDAWRKALDYWCLTKWQLAVSSLSAGYGVYGCFFKHRHPHWPRHYSGNFWWTTSEDIRLRSKLTKTFMEDRFNAEFWAGSSSLSAYNAFNVPVMLYDVCIPRNIYSSYTFNSSNLRYFIQHFRHNLRHALFLV